MQDRTMKVRCTTDARGRSLVTFRCPGCESDHTLSVAGPGAIWGWDGSTEAPTFTPSVLIRSGHYVPGEEGKDCWCSFEKRFGRKLPKGVGCGVCHSFVRGGRIEFLGDCTHALAGQAVPLPDYPTVEPANG